MPLTGLALEVAPCAWLQTHPHLREAGRAELLPPNPAIVLGIKEDEIGPYCTCTEVLSLRLSKRTDYGIVVMTCLAEEPKAIRAANEVSACTGGALPTVSKVLKLLSRALLDVSCGGAKGGYRLARAAENISVGEVIDALEGPVALTECTSESSSCSQESHCTVRGNWQRINSAIRQALNGVSLAEMVRPVASREMDVGGLQLPRRAQVLGAVAMPLFLHLIGSGLTHAA